MVIYFLRHASAGKNRANPKQDEKRRLDKEGIEQCREVGRALAAADSQVDVIISSPLKRATQTASLVGNEMGYESDLRIEPALRPGAKFVDFRKMLYKYNKFDAIMIVGHNPALSEFCGQLLTGSDENSVIDLKKGAVARLDYDGKNDAQLLWCITPRLVRSIHASETDKLRPKTSRK